MIANFFRSLSGHQVEYLLISGQATVLYGAATFSEDIDLWVNPAEDNRVRFLTALRACGARYYKLTPAFEGKYLERGHGFHFVLPGKEEPDVFLDVMGAPPRVGGFGSVRDQSVRMDTEWGPLPTIDLRSLVELKKTQRLEDYPIIGKLVLAWFDRPGASPAASDYSWALRNLFTLPELRAFFEAQPAALDAIRSETISVAGLHEFGRALLAQGDVPDDLSSQVNRALQQRIAELQDADRRHWRGIIAELRDLRGRGELMPQSSAV
jgi:hypothetical protein